MKSERRHELQHNELRDWLATNYERIKPYQNAILGGVVLLLVAMIAWSWLGKRSAARDAQAWQAMDQAMNVEIPPYMRQFRAMFDPATFREPASFEKVIQEHKGTPAAAWAAVMAGDLYLQSGTENLFRNKATAQQDLSRAVDYYQGALQGASGPLVRERATFGLAQALEAQIKLDEAATHYGQVVKQWPNGMFAAKAEDRLKELEKPETKWFYDKFAEFKPQAAVPPKDLPEAPSAKTTPSAPEKDLPDDPTLDYRSPFSEKMPGKEKTIAPPAETPKPAPETKPVTPVEEPKTETPKTETPKTETPADAAPEKTAEKPVEKAEEKTAEKAEEKPAEKPAEKPLEAPAEKASEKPAEKPAEPTPPKPAEKS